MFLNNYIFYSSILEQKNMKNNASQALNVLISVVLKKTFLQRFYYLTKFQLKIIC